MTELHRLRADELEMEMPVAVEVGDLSLCVVRTTDGIFAFEDICTHQRNVKLSEGFVEGNTIECPQHQACFDLRTGAVVTPPATEAIRVFDVIDEGAEILIVS